MPDIMIPFWVTVFSVPILFQAGAGFTLVPRAPYRLRSFILPSLTVLLATPLAWLFFRLLLAPVMTWIVECILIYLLVFALQVLLRRFCVSTKLFPEICAGSEEAVGESSSLDAFPWLAVCLSFSLSWSFLTAMLAASGCLASLIIASFFMRLVEWRTELERKGRGVQGLLLRLIMAILMVFFFLLVAQLIFPREVLL